MGLPSGNLWAKSNIDLTQPNNFASSPFQYECSFVSWGNIEMHNPIDDASFEYNWGGVNAEDPYYDGQVYGSTPGNELTADIAPSQDAARANLGSPWRIPTANEFKELLDNCNFVQADGTTIIDAATTDKRVTVDGIVGIYLKSKNNGNKLFFACSGRGSGASWVNHGSGGYYWSSSFDNARDARFLFFHVGGVNPQALNARSYGFAIRAVFNNNGIRALKALKKYDTLFIDVKDSIINDDKLHVCMDEHVESNQ